MATKISYTTTVPTQRYQTSGLAGGSASLLRLVPSPEVNACEVVLTPSEYAEFRQSLEAAPRVIPELAALFRARRRHTP